SMMAEARRFSGGGGRSLRFGVTTGLRPLPSWKREADFLMTQVSFSLDDLLRWRDTVPFDGPVYAGVMVIASPAMARKLSAGIPELAVPRAVVERVEGDSGAGIALAHDLVRAVRDSGAFAGVHLVPVARYREMAALLEQPL
ncbi:MAG: methylenetetrahydrofolate reductase, partial [Acidimicrobiales bacterium]